jgi:hypothetical protein
MVKKDFIASIVLIAFSISVVVSSYTMPRLERRGIDPFSAPGVVPGMIGMILLCLSLILFVRSVRAGGYRLFGAGRDSGGAENPGAVQRVLLTLLISLGYAVGLLGRIDYTAATLLYIFGFIVLFEYRRGVSPLRQKKMLGRALLLAVIAAIATTLVFRKLFLVDLP